MRTDSNLVNQPLEKARFKLLSPRATVSSISDEPHQQDRRSEFFNIPVTSVKSSIFGPLAAIGLNLVVIAFLIVITTTNVYVRHYGDVSNRVRALYVLGVTILASLVASHTTGCAKVLMLKKAVPDFEGEDVPLTNRRQAGVIVGLGGLRDQIRKWEISAVFTAIGLTTSAIVAAFTLATVPVEQGIGGHAGPGHNINNCVVGGSDGTANATFSWKAGSNLYLYVNETINSHCPVHNVLPILQNYAPVASRKWAYTLNNIPVDQSAVGVPCRLPFMDFSGPFAIDSNPTSRYYGSDAEFEWVTQCFPVLVSNPVRCVENGTVVAGRDSVTVSLADFSSTTPIHAVDPASGGASSAGAWTDGYEIGKAAMLIGAVNEQANQLASIMAYDKAQTTSGSAYSVVCSVDVAPAISYRLVNYSRVYNADETGFLSHTWQVSSYDSGPCSPSNKRDSIPLSSWLTPETLATGAAASVQLLKQGKYASGPLPNLYSIVENIATIGGRGFDGDLMIFPDSQNPLEDVLGLVSGIALGFHWGAAGKEDLNWDSGTASILGVRIGSGETWAILYILPSAFSVIILAWLMWTTRHQAKSP